MPVISLPVESVITAVMVNMLVCLARAIFDASWRNLVIQNKIYNCFIILGQVYLVIDNFFLIVFAFLLFLLLFVCCIVST